MHSYAFNADDSPLRTVLTSQAPKDVGGLQANERTVDKILEGAQSPVM